MIAIRICAIIGLCLLWALSWWLGGILIELWMRSVN